MKQMGSISRSWLPLLVASLVTVAIAGHAQADNGRKTRGSWSPVADMGTARQSHQAVVL
jgi:hypothetical protein